MRSDERVVVPERVAPVTRPRPVPRRSCEPGAYRVPLDVAHAEEQLRPGIYRRGVVGFLPYRIDVPVRRGEMMRIARNDRRDEASGAVRADRGEEQVDMVAHQRPGVDRAFGFERALAKQPEIREAVAGARKAGAAFAPALHHVQRGMSFLDRKST